ncbi:hypothetical protein, partial [uncultured Lamprocystis sp.]
MKQSASRTIPARASVTATPARVSKRRMLLIGGAALLQLAAGAQAALNADQFIEARDGDGRPVIDSAGET